MKWKIVNYSISTDDKVEKSNHHLFLKFPESTWNNVKYRPVIEIEFYNRKVEGGWWLDRNKTEWYTQKPYKTCKIRFFYFQSHPELEMYSSHDNCPNYEDFTIEYCKEKAFEIFKERLDNIYKQLIEPKELLIENTKIYE